MIDDLSVSCFTLAGNFHAQVHFFALVRLRYDARHQLLIDKEAVGDVGAVLVLRHVGFGDQGALELG